MPKWTLHVNGEEHRVEEEPSTPLLWVLRDRLGLTGTKFGCGRALCGVCKVHLDGVAMPSCVTPISVAAGREITTIEGLARDGLHAVQRAWVEEDVAQCGYCQAGQIMTAAALLAENPNPSDDEIIMAMSGTLCRCGTYPRIRRAVHRAVALLRGRP